MGSTENPAAAVGLEVPGLHAMVHCINPKKAATTVPPWFLGALTPQRVRVKWKDDDMGMKRS